MRVLRRSRKRRGRAYTVAELLVAAALSAIVVIGALRWAGAIGQVALGALRESDASQATLALARFDRDVSALAHCDSYGRDAKVRELASDAVVFTADPDGDGEVEAISWRVEGEALQRSSAPMNKASCELPEFTEWVTQLGDVDATGTWFAPVMSGTVSRDPGGYRSCVDAFSQGCSLATLTLHVQRAGADEQAEITSSGEL